jgi:hypothetical protein
MPMLPSTLRCGLLILPLVLAAAAFAQLAPPNREIPLYDGVAPGSENWSYQ